MVELVSCWERSRDRSKLKSYLHCLLDMRLGRGIRNVVVCPIWRRVPGLPLYASSAGDVARCPGKPLRKTLSDSGYWRVRSRIGGAVRSILCHNAVLLAFVGPRPSPAHHGAHGNGDQLDNRLSNLSWKTKVENEADKRAHGTAPRVFSGHRRADHVPAVRALLGAGKSFSAVARELGMHRSSVSRIARGLRHASR